jgi:hypothetical protein
MKYIWLSYLQILFLLHQFSSKKNWIDKQILLCYTRLDELEVNYVRIFNLDK